MVLQNGDKAPIADDFSDWPPLSSNKLDERQTYSTMVMNAGYVCLPSVVDRPYTLKVDASRPISWLQAVSGYRKSDWPEGEWIETACFQSMGMWITAAIFRPMGTLCFFLTEWCLLRPDFCLFAGFTPANSHNSNTWVIMWKLVGTFNEFVTKQCPRLYFVACCLLLRHIFILLLTHINI